MNKIAGVAFISVAVKRFGANVASPAMKATWRAVSSKFASKVAEESIELTALKSAAPMSTAVDEAADAAVTTGLDEAASIAAGKAGTALTAELAGDEAAVAAGVISKLGLPEMSNLAVAGGIFVAVGFDVILGAIEGAIENNQLEGKLKDMRKSLADVQDFLDNLADRDKKLDAEIEIAGQALKNVLHQLNKIQQLPPDLNAKLKLLTPKATLSTYNSVAVVASTKYGILCKIRQDAYGYLQNCKSDGSTATLHMFKTMQRMMIPKTIYPDKVLYGYLDYVVAHSEELSKLAGAAKPAAPALNMFLAAPAPAAPTPTTPGVAQPVAMSVLPFDEWFCPSIPKLEKELHEKKDQYMTGRNNAGKLHSKLVKEVDSVKSFVAYNTTLLIAATAWSAPNDKFKKYADSALASAKFTLLMSVEGQDEADVVYTTSTGYVTLTGDSHVKKWDNAKSRKPPSFSSFLTFGVEKDSALEQSLLNAEKSLMCGVAHAAPDCFACRCASRAHDPDQAPP